MTAAPALRTRGRVATAPGAIAATAAVLLVTGCGVTSGTAPGEGGDGHSAPVATTGPTGAAGAQPGDEEDQVSTPSEDPTRSPASLPTGPVPTDLDQQPRVRAAISDLAGRLEVTEDDVTVAGWAEVTWPDGSLGCPQEDMMYTQALIPGEQLVLRAAGELFSYHAAEGQDFAYCADPTPPVADETS